jgi:hypothetical protein
MLKKIFTRKSIILVSTTTFIGILLKIILSLMEIELNDFLHYPLSVICTLFSITYIKYIIKCFMEEVVIPQYITMNNPAENTGSSQQGNTSDSQGNTQQGDNDNTVFQGKGFTCQNGIYAIHDPTNVSARGFLSPTGQPFDESCQPFASNLAAAMTHEYDTNHHMSLASNKYGPGVERFHREFMVFTYPTRPSNMYFNSNPVRKALRNLP